MNAISWLLVLYYPVLFLSLRHRLRPSKRNNTAPGCAVSPMPFTLALIGISQVI